MKNNKIILEVKSLSEIKESIELVDSYYLVEIPDNNVIDDSDRFKLGTFHKLDNGEIEFFPNAFGVDAPWSFAIKDIVAIAKIEFTK